LLKSQSKLLLPQIRALKGTSAEVASDELCIPEAGPSEIRVLKLRLPQSGSVKVRAVETRAAQVSKFQLSASKIGVSQIHRIGRHLTPPPENIPNCLNICRSPSSTMRTFGLVIISPSRLFTNVGGQNLDNRIVKAPSVVRDRLQCVNPAQLDRGPVTS